MLEADKYAKDSRHFEFLYSLFFSLLRLGKSIDAEAAKEAYRFGAGAPGVNCAVRENEIREGEASPMDPNRKRSDPVYA